MLVGHVSGTELEYPGNIFLAGLSASGKTTHSYLLAGIFGLTYVSGSQTHLAINGMSPVQERAFWIGERAKELFTKAQFQLVDRELKRIESNTVGCIFDSWIMPWRKTGAGLSIYLYSTLESRLLKAAVSRHENSFAIDKTFADAVTQKDIAGIELYKELYGTDIENDLSVFDLVIDTSTFIDSPTFEAAQRSIRTTEAILEAAVGYYITGSSEHYHKLQQHRGRHYVLHNTLM